MGWECPLFAASSIRAQIAVGQGQSPEFGYPQRPDTMSDIDIADTMPDSADTMSDSGATAAQLKRELEQAKELEDACAKLRDELRDVQAKLDEAQ